MNDRKPVTTNIELFERIGKLSDEIEWSNEELQESLQERGIDPDQFVGRVRSNLAHLLNLSPQVSSQKVDSLTMALPAFLKRLREAGIDKKLLHRFLPQTLRGEVKAFNTGAKHREPSLVSEVAAAVSQVYGWAVETIVNPAIPLELNPAAMSRARFKLPARTNEQRLSVYTVYVHTVAMILLEATAHLPCQPIPATAEEIRRGIKRTYGSINFENALRYVWSLGIPVLPLSDVGAFHGACWRVEGHNVIVLKQKVRSLARWLFDLIHELDHAGKHPEQPNLSLIEGEGTPIERRNSPEEQEAHRTAGDVVLDGRADELAQQCVIAASGEIKFLKRAAQQVARREGVAVDALANYLAYRLSLRGQQWWSAATNLQNTAIDPLRIARAVLLEHVDFSRLNEFDRNLLQQALLDEANLEVQNDVSNRK